MFKTLLNIGEFGLIELIRKNSFKTKDVFCGIGDDTAVIRYNASEYLLFTTDMLAEGVHFKRNIKPEGIGHKALACSISDIAAMGGVPSYAVISFGAPGRTSLVFVSGVFRGINKLAKQFKVSIVGGDTIKSDKVIVNVSLLGKVRKKELVLRGGAKKGDVIFATGPLGRSLKNGKHVSFIPRIKESQFLVKKFKPSSMIDISDGLVSDLRHILEDSSVGAILHEESIPKMPKANLQNALYDGEDFELLFTLSPQKAKRLSKLRATRFKFYEIGRIVDKRNGLQLADKKGKKSGIKKRGYEHF